LMDNRDRRERAYAQQQVPFRRRNSLDHQSRQRMPNRRGGTPARSPTWSYPAQSSDR
jgi:hypothetical protein